jgi:MFS family permease
MPSLKIPNWLAAPDSLTPQQQRNFLNVQIDAIGIGVYSAAVPFLPVFLTRLGASSFQVGLLTSLPALAGFVLGLPVGRFLQGRRNIVPWFSAARLLVISSYLLTGLVPFLVPPQHVISTVLWIQAAATLPQTVVFVAFSVVMNAVAGPRLRLELMSRRWSTLGLTTAITAMLAGQILDRLPFPINYQLVFMGFSLGGLISYYFSSHIQLPEAEPEVQPVGLSWRQRVASLVDLLRREPAFVSFAIKRFVYQSGAALAAPLFPLYYVYEMQASDAWIGFFNTAQTATTLVGYPVWTRWSRQRGARLVLLCTTFGLALYPALTAATLRAEWVAVYAGLAGIFAAGLNLVFFDELMKTVPVQYSATFVAVAQSLQHLSTMVSPLLGTALADRIGLAGALVAGGALRLVGFLLFVRREPSTETPSP